MRKALALLGETIAIDERSRLTALISESNPRSPTTKSSGSNARNTALDEGTQQLASMLLDRAMEAALERKMQADC